MSTQNQKKQQDSTLDILKSCYSQPKDNLDKIKGLDVEIINRFLIKSGKWDKAFRFLKKQDKIQIFIYPKSKKTKDLIKNAKENEKIQNQKMSEQLKKKAMQRRKRIDKQKKLLSQF